MHNSCLVDWFTDQGQGGKKGDLGVTSPLVFRGMSQGSRLRVTSLVHNSSMHMTNQKSREGMRSGK